MANMAHTEINFKYGSGLRKARKMANLTQVEAAKKLGIAVNSLRLYEADKRLPSIAILIKMTEVYNADFLDMGIIGEINFQQKPVEYTDKDRLLKAFDHLNSKGQSIAVERVYELTKIPDYQRFDGPQASEE